MVARVTEGVHNLEALELSLLLMLRGLHQHLRAEFLGRLVHVQAAQQLAHRRSADVGEEGRVAFLLGLRLQKQELLFREEHILLHA